IADITHKLGKHFISGGVEGGKGQVLTLLNDKDCPLIGEIFPMTPEELEFRSKGMIGVLGPAPSTIASIQAAEVMRILLYKEEVKSHLIFIDLKNSIFQSIEI
ncbi:MAG: ThiF family adenylyltransferase, partial [Muribaculaceae bacterium]|nr:ThiF family adenylyltransferase [Muribaculaceae bacterium]